MLHTFDFPLPPTLNKQIDEARSGWYKSAETKEIWTNLIAEESRNSCMFLGEVWMDFVWGIPKFDHDPDNVAAAAKYILDGLTQSKVIQNDNLTIIQSPILHWYERDQNAGVTVTISDNPYFLIERIQTFKELYEIHTQKTLK